MTPINNDIDNSEKVLDAFNRNVFNSDSFLFAQKFLYKLVNLFRSDLLLLFFLDRCDAGLLNILAYCIDLLDSRDISQLLYCVTALKDSSEIKR